MDRNKRIMLVDTSYYVFYRFYALLQWYSISKQPTQPDVPHIDKDEVFLDKFAHLFVDHFKKLLKKHKVASGSQVVFAKDCMRHSIWRHALYDGYKATRDTSSRNFNGYIFEYTFEHVIPKLQREMGVHVVHVPEAEADDVIGVMKRNLRAEHPNTPITIITNDHDFLQAADGKTDIVNLKGVNLKEKGFGSPELDLKMKILMGDTSDNIPPVFSRCAKAKLMEYAHSEEALEVAFARKPGSRTQYELNRVLIDHTYIPDRIVEKIDAALQGI